MFVPKHPKPLVGIDNFLAAHGAFILHILYDSPDTLSELSHKVGGSLKKKSRNKLLKTLLYTTHLVSVTFTTYV